MTEEKMMPFVYSEKFYKNIHNWSLNSAKKIVPILIKRFNPGSAIDID
jgi:hypothetical protein